MNCKKSGMNGKLLISKYKAKIKNEGEIQMRLKLISVLMIAAFVAAPAVMGQQSADSSREMSIEESYLQEAIELMIIRETSRGDSRDQKYIALEYIGNAVERGNTSSEIRAAVEFLALEGTQNRAMESGRLVNNFPDVRRQAARYLGAIGTEEAKTALIKICSTDNEPMVIQEAIKSLGSIDAGNSDEAVSVIVWVVNRFNNSAAPDNLMALAAIDALDKIAERDKGLKDAGAVQVLVRIAEGSYSPPVRERARQAIMDLRKYTAR
jgi:hypothetical protein